MLASELLPFLDGNRATILQVQFVANKHLEDAGVGMLVDRVNPRFHVDERLLVRNVERDDHAVRLPVERVRDRAKSLLPCRVPDLHRYFFAVRRRVACRDVVQPDRGEVRLGKRLLGVPRVGERGGAYILSSEVLPTAPSPRMMI